MVALYGLPAQRLKQSDAFMKRSTSANSPLASHTMLLHLVLPRIDGMAEMEHWVRPVSSVVSSLVSVNGADHINSTRRTGFLQPIYMFYSILLW